MAFRTDLAVEAIENMDKAADVRQVRQAEHTIEGFSVDEVDILTERAAREIGKPRAGCAHPPRRGCLPPRLPRAQLAAARAAA